MSKSFDVIVVGAGPAGGQCARQLSAAGKKVLLVEKAKDFSINNYSSGGAPAELIRDYSLPPSIVGSTWNQIDLYTSTKKHRWKDPSYKGVVLDFMKLRAYLAEQVLLKGSQMLLDHAYLRHESRGDSTQVFIKDMHNHETKVYETRVLVDATGAERRVLMQGRFDKKRALAATGIEYLIEVDPDLYKRYSQTLSFFLGLKWMPQGYAWIFPMEANRLKIGVVRYFAHELIVPHEPSYRHYLEKMLEENNFPAKNYQILDTHGKTLYYFRGQKDSMFDNNVIAIGDAISTLNPMASEGIRHAMYSGALAAAHISRYLEGDSKSFSPFVKEMRKYFGFRWKTSEFIMNWMYKERQDNRLETYAEAFRSLSFKDMLDFSFDYKLSTILKFFWHVLALSFGKRALAIK